MSPSRSSRTRKLIGAFRDAHLHDVFVEIQEGKRGHAAHVNGGLTRLQFGARGFVGPELVAHGHRTVHGGATPVACAARLKRNRAVKKTDARHARRRIAFVRAGILARTRRKAEKTGQPQQRLDQFALPANVVFMIEGPLFRPTYIRCVGSATSRTRYVARPFITPKTLNPKVEKKLHVAACTTRKVSSHHRPPVSKPCTVKAFVLCIVQVLLLNDVCCLFRPPGKRLK